MKIACVVLSESQNPIKEAKILYSAIQNLPATSKQLWYLDHAHSLDALGNLPFNEVIYFQHPNLKNYIGEKYLPILQELFFLERPDMVFFYGNISGNELAARLAYRLSGDVYTEIMEASYIEDNLSVKKPAYSHNLITEYTLQNKPSLLTLGKGHYDPSEITGSPKITLYQSSLSIQTPDEFLECSSTPLVQEQGMDTAKVILAGGRGVGSKESMDEIEKLATHLHGVLGVTRAAALNTWKSTDYMIGISGQITKPDLALVFGASGATPFIAGIEKSKFIISVNTDPSALVFQQSDVGIVGDSEEIVKELLLLLTSQE